MLRLRFISGYPWREAGGFCWSGISGHETLICPLAEKLGFLFGPHFGSWGKFCCMMVFMCCHDGYDAVIVWLYLLIMCCLYANNWFFRILVMAS